MLALISGFQTQSLGLSPSRSFYISLYTSLGIVISMSCNGYVYAFRSTEYRAAFKKLLFKQNSVDRTNVITVKSTKQIVAGVQMTRM
jgi:hypothetical protein